MRRHVYKRIRRAFNATFKNKGNFVVSVPINIVTLVILYSFGWIEQVAWEIRLLAMLIITGTIVYGFIFLWSIIRTPAPKQGDANFLISWKDAEVISGTSDGLPSAESNMHWIQVGTYIETNYDIIIDSLLLSLKGKRYEAYGWKPTTTQKMGPNPRYYHFQIPRIVDLTKHRGEIVVLTDKEDYGSVKFIIKQ